MSTKASIIDEGCFVGGGSIAKPGKRKQRLDV